MGSARVLGRDTVLKINLGGVQTTVGEIDKFSAKKIDELKKSQPLGEKLPTSNVVHMGWELSIEGGKIDWALASAVHAQDTQIVAGGRSPYFEIEQTVTFYDGSVEVYTYKDVSLHGYELDMGSATDEITEKISGFASTRTIGTSSTNLIIATVNTARKSIATALKQLGSTILAKGTDV